MGIKVELTVVPQPTVEEDMDRRMAEEWGLTARRMAEWEGTVRQWEWDRTGAATAVWVVMGVVWEGTEGWVDMVGWEEVTAA